jgi:hypothetical protein
MPRTAWTAPGATGALRTPALCTEASASARRTVRSSSTPSRWASHAAAVSLGIRPRARAASARVRASSLSSACFSGSTKATEPVLPAPTMAERTRSASPVAFIAARSADSAAAAEAGSTSAS